MPRVRIADGTRAQTDGRRTGSNERRTTNNERRPATRREESTMPTTIRKTVHIVLLALCASVSATGAQAKSVADCRRLDAAAGGADDNFRPPVSGTIVGSGRAYFHSAPDPQCMTKRVFVVPGDSVTVYKPHGRWFDVMYVSARTGEDVEGWIEQDRVRLGAPIGGQ
jgi:hypothetical protein